MKKCETENCTANIDEKYTYCYHHYKPGGVTQLKNDQWHDDPKIDVLLKINANLGKLVQAIEALPRKK